jgi:hemolysin activation/secretion protein
VVRWRQGLPLRIALSADDGGADSTGQYQGRVTLSYDHGLALNDLLYASLDHDLGGGDPGRRGTRGHTVHYSVPYGYWLLGLTSGRHAYHQSVAGANDAIVYRGESEDGEIALARVLYRDARRKTGLAAKALARRSRNFIDDTEVEVQRRRTGGWELSLSHREFIGRSVVDANVAYRRGTGAFGAMPAPEEAFGEGSSRFRIAGAHVSATVPASFEAPWGEQPVRYGGALRAQWHYTPLVPQDRFSIGGRYSVRGFDGESSLVAERGWWWRNELAFGIGASGHEAWLGLDHGTVGGPSAERLVGTRLTGAAFGLRGARRGLSYECFVGWPVRKPAGFETANVTAGFSLNWTS